MLTSRVLRLSTSGVPAPLSRSVRPLRLLPPLSTLPVLSPLMLERRRCAAADGGAGLASLPTDARRAYMPVAKTGRVRGRQAEGGPHGRPGWAWESNRRGWRRAGAAVDGNVSQHQHNLDGPAPIRSSCALPPTRADRGDASCGNAQNATPPPRLSLV